MIIYPYLISHETGSRDPNSIYTRLRDTLEMCIFTMFLFDVRNCHMYMICMYYIAVFFIEVVIICQLSFRKEKKGEKK